VGGEESLLPDLKKGEECFTPLSKRGEEHNASASTAEKKQEE
jgi:hypothetical protein